jgi:NitT/TauT family transport system permease protein
MKKWFQPLIGIALFIIVWQVLATTINKNVIIPQPAETLVLLVNSLFSPEILFAILETAWKVLLALLLAVVVGLLTGLVLGRSETLYGVFRPLIMVIQAVPVVSWLTLVIFVWGLGWKGPVFIAFLSLLPISILTTVSGVHNLDQGLLEMARLYQVPQRKVIKDIYLGSLLPFMIAILDVSIGQAWKVILVAEYLCGGNGLGVKILSARMSIDVPEVWALTLMAVLFGILSEYLIKFGLGKATSKWTVG